MSRGVECRCVSDLALLWLRHRPSATAPIRPLASEPPYAASEGLKGQKKKDKKESVCKTLGAVPQTINIGLGAWIGHF